MGGKHKQAQRTKNNARPSSSSRSAEILGNMVPTYVGFSTAKDGGLVPILPGFSVKEDIDPNIDPNFQLVLKKFGKKDSTTKLKALNEFTALVTSSEESVVCAALSLWPRYYGQLSTDVEHRIREAAQVAHGAVAQKCGRSLAPYLKQLAPVWITSQYDTYVPAALQAQAALQTVFPAPKLPEVLSFCRNEIFSYICDNLINQSPTTLSNPKTNTPEECEAKYERVIIASLQGYALLIHNLPEIHLDWLCLEQEKILDNSKFWNYGTHKTPQIRTSCYNVLGSLSERLSSWFGPKYGNKASQLLLTQLNEKELNVTISVWENAIILMANIPEWWKLVKMDEGVLPSICETLSAGGWGSAGRMAPLLLPLFAHLSASTLSQQFYDTFFEAILKGAEQRCVVSSRSECSAWMGGLAECLRYVSVGVTNSEYTIQSLSRALRLWLILISRSHISINPLTPLKVSIGYMSDMIKFWTKQSLSSKNPSFFSQLLRLFWQNVLFVITSQVEKFNPDDDLKEMTDIHRELLTGLKYGVHIKLKKASKVKFDSDQNQDDSNEVDKSPDSSLLAQSNDSGVIEIYERELFSTAHDVCALYLDWAKTKNVSAPILGPLYSLLLEFDCFRAYTTISHFVLKDKPGGEILYLYTELFFNWLKGDSMRSQAVVDLTFALFNYLSDDEQRELLKTFDQLTLSTIKWGISRCLSYPNSSRPSVRDWLKGDLVHQSIVSMTHLVVKEGDRHHATLLKMCFAQDIHGGILINEKTCSNIILILAESLSHHDSEHLDMCASFASQLAASLCSDDKYLGIQELLLSLFVLNCNVQGESEVLSSDTWWEVNTSWQDALSTFSWERLIDFTEKASDVVFHKLVKNAADAFDIENMTTLVNLSFNLICSCLNTCNLGNSDFGKLCRVIEIILKVESKELQTWLTSVHSKSLIADIFNGNLDAPFAGDSVNLKGIIKDANKKTYDELVESDLQNVLKWLLFCTKLIDKVLVNSEKSKVAHESSDDEYCSEEFSSFESQSFLSDAANCDYMENILSNLLYNIAIVKTLFNEYQAWRWYITLTEYYKIIETTASHAIQSLTDESYLSMLCFIKNKADTEGMYWSVCLQMCAESLKKSEKTFDLNVNLKTSVQVLRSMQNAESIDEYSKKHLCHNMNITERKTADNQDYLNISATLAMISMHLSSSSEKLTDIVISKEDFVTCSTSPMESLSLIIDKYYKCKELMLYDIDFTSANWELVSCNASIVRFLTACIQSNGWELESHHWDFITITLSSLIQSIDKSKNSWNTIKVSLLGCEVFKLFCAVDTFIKNIPSECLRREPTPCITNLPQEWTDIFAPDIHQHLIQIFSHVFGDCVCPENVTSRDIFFFHALDDVMQKFNMKYLVSDIAHTVDSIMSVCLDVLSVPSIHLLKFIAHNVMKSLTPILIESDKIAASSTFTDEEETVKPLILSVHKMVSSLTHLQECVDAVLSPYTTGEDTCTLIPYTDSYNMTLGYLLLWETMLNISQESVTFLQYQYTEFFREGKYVEHLVCALFRLLPNESQPPTNASNYFKNPPELLNKVVPRSELLSGLSCGCLVQSLRVGAVHCAIRGWWGALPARTAQYVERIVRAHVSPILIALQLAEVARKQKELPNVEFSIHPSVNEVLCKYIVDQTKMELIIELCSNHPLGIPRVTSSGGPTNNVAWITMFLSHQNGTLWQTVTLWLNSIQRKLDSVPECYVCYCKLHPVTGKLPKITCHTCKNKSHQVCLKKWFSTSGNTTCPMCRAHMTLK